MSPAVLLAGILGASFAVLGSAKVVAAPTMRERARHVGFSVPAYRWIGALELAAVLGLALGGTAPIVGLLAAAGLVALLGGALVVHVRNGDGWRHLAPAAVLAVLAVVLVTVDSAGLR